MSLTALLLTRPSAVHEEHFVMALPVSEIYRLHQDTFSLVHEMQSYVQR
jgi:hypothetical protein